MAPDLRENQLELFDLSRQQPARMSRESLGRVFVQFRHDQIVLGSIAGLLGLTVIFACGVERGKQLVRSERVLLARQQQQTAQSPEPDPKRAAAAPGVSVPATVPAAKPMPAPAAVKAVPAPPAVKKQPSAPAKAKEKTKVAAAPTSGSSRFAVQVVTYTQPQMARQEMERLRAKGEPVFLLMRDGRTIVYVGPFPSKTNASERLGRLKARYQDCFIKSL